MKLYIIECNNDLGVDYDQFDSFVVRASSKESAWELAKKLVLSASFREQRARYFNEDDFSIEELLTDGEEKIIVASYNAG
jgi:hypothetical protein